ncbi:hypothetical protein MYX04_11635 [Nitrospiraceae bacterium AH_259_D15_M11_P09]|nr:hypothetical protein [Nitrospiraceae bacterium AH_259_D15_M11_P09]
MGRPRKGKVAGVSPRGRPVRVTERLEKLYYPLKRKPRGEAARTFEFTNFLKERAPLVYVFVVSELRKAKVEHEGLQRIIGEWRQASDVQEKPSLELTAYVMERALRGTWELWGIKPPFSSRQCDSFYRRYIHGHPGAIKVFRKCILEPKPWHRWHVGHQLEWFLGKPGAAAEHYRLLDRKPTLLPVLTIREE